MASIRSSPRAIERLQAENEFLRRGGVAAEVGKTLRAAFVLLAVLAIVYFIDHAVQALAGKQTEANILVNFLTKFEVSVALGWAVGAGGLIYGRSQRKLRKASVARLSERLQAFEAEIDPKRTTSTLRSNGDTNPEDK